MNFAKLSTADLLFVHNIAAAAKVARFSDRKTAEKRTAAALELPEARSRLAMSERVCPFCGDRHNGLTYGHDEDHMFCHVCCTEYHAESGRVYKARAASTSTSSAAISASWKRPEVFAARTTRVGVRVSTKDGSAEFSSVPKAFERLSLPSGAMIRTRMAVKVAGRVEFRGYVFEAI